MAKGVKKRKLGSGTGSPQPFRDQPDALGVEERRVLRSRYIAIQKFINDIMKGSLEKFWPIMTHVDSLHKMVNKPREQVADAVALLDIANTLVTSVRSQTNGELTPSDFLTSLIKNSGKIYGGSLLENVPNTKIWVDVGLIVAPILRISPAFHTMVGPMNTDVKQRKTSARGQRTRPAGRAYAKELTDTEGEKKVDTDMNMITMFDILRKNKSIRLENLVLNRTSFAQTVENLFTLSFLVKDGRVSITVNMNEHHIVSPKNAPAATSITSGDASYNQFIFRLDFNDWKLMINIVKDGEDVMPHRNFQTG
ncbi:non-structural maintenance of chromosomes element 4 homolog A-like isoform X2 [Dioscorea cayenensis subsp. rotundata]|uniref:Non-structural maintenance of chromosomes element 4 n=1 Tax=Dioscorea cayennensis subsp. rotundata TaxID=55577 RepID=A0AB40BG15_DIOCR|nr:non-structural maintenance of chromosomes element 4 homolog A-like isoform X2 [Dioscorea cayenensis subsp. rotundata]